VLLLVFFVVIFDIIVHFLLRCLELNVLTFNHLLRIITQCFNGKLALFHDWLDNYFS